MELRPDLIYDIGVNNGDDTAYYLYKGYRVLGIEADPVLVGELEQRFAAEVASGRLSLLNIALAPTRTVAPFFICEGYSLWNSFDRATASRMGKTAREVVVQCWPLSDIFAEHGVPHYLKMSLHGEEHFCLKDITAGLAPTYLSLELPREAKHGDEIFSRLAQLGYSRCKIIDQTTQKQLVITPPSVTSRLRKTLKRYPPLYGAAQGIVGAGRRMFGSNAPPQQPAAPSVGGWTFPEGSSGPFGEDTTGPWKRVEETWEDWKAFLGGKTGQDPAGLSIWHDLHAVRASGA